MVNQYSILLLAIMLLLLMVVVIAMWDTVPSIAVERKEPMFHFRNVAVHNSDRNIFRHSLQTIIGRREDTSLVGCVRIGWRIVTDFI